MSDTLVIRLGTSDSPLPGGAGQVTAVQAEWTVVDATGACVLAPGTGALTDAAALCAGRRTVVLVPSPRVLRTRAEVPVKGASRIALALPFALEDVLADDVEDLHFVAGPRLADGQVAVAVVRRDLMTAWQAQLAAAEIFPQALCADSDGVLDIAGTSTLLLDHQYVLLRDPGSDPVVAELSSLDSILGLWLAQPRATSADGATAPRNLQVYDATVDGLPNTIWEQLKDQLESLEVRRLPDGALLRLAAAIVTQPGINLLQGDYARRNSASSYWPRWRLAAVLAAGLATAILAATGADTWRLKRENTALEAEIRQAASFVFPGVDPGGDLRGLVTARLQAGNGGASGAASRQFLDTLGTVALAVAKAGDASIQGLNYRAGVLEVEVRAPSANSLDTIRKFVSEAGTLKAEIQSSNAAGDQIEGRIRISGGGA